MAEGKNAPGPRVANRQDFVSRYQAGDYAVWDELARQDEAVRGHPDLHAEAMAVARLLMQRVRQNADQVRATLCEAGAVLGDEVPPTSDAELEPLIDIVGPLPIALQAFWSVVGSINLTPRYVPNKDPDYGECRLQQEGISLLALDPLQIDGAEVEYLLGQQEEGEPLFVHVCPDFLGKQHISGSGPLSIELPARDFDRVDPDLGDDQHPALVPYLRNSFAYGGFPLLEVAKLPSEEIHINFRTAFEGVKGPWGPAAERLRAKLCRGLVPF